MQVKPFPSVMFWKSSWVADPVTVLRSITKRAGEGVVSVSVQLGPRAPMKDVLPTSTLFSTVKLLAEDMAMPYPKAPVSWLFNTVPDWLTLLPYRSPNQVRGPMAMPILGERGK